AAERKPRASLALFHAEQEVTGIASVIDQLKSEARRAPDAESAWRTRARQAGVSAEVHISLQILDELRRSRLLVDSATWPPSRWHAEYQRALTDPTAQDHATMIRIVEDQHGNGFAGAKATSDRELAIGHELRTLIATTQDRRIPKTVHDADAVVAS